MFERMRGEALCLRTRRGGSLEIGVVLRMERLAIDGLIGGVYLVV